MTAAGTGVASATDEGYEPSHPGCADLSTATYGEGEPSTPCGEEPGVEPDVRVTIDRDCAEPETLTLHVEGEGLWAEDVHVLTLESAGFLTDLDASYFEVPLVVDEDGTVSVDLPATEDADVTLADGPFTVDFTVYATYEEHGYEAVEYVVDEGHVDVPACEAPATPPVTPPVTQPVVPVTPAPTTAPVTTPAVPTVVPVAVHPVTAAPAVLANTGSPVTTAALLGGGLLVAGAGALVATRRRAS